MKATILLHQAQPGMVLYSPIINETGKVILEEGAALTRAMLDRLHALQVDVIHIKLTNEVISPKEQFDSLYLDTLCHIKEYFSKVTYFKEVPVAQMRELVDNPINLMLEIPGAIQYLNNVQHSDDCTFKHSLSVAAISGILAKWAGYTGEKLKNMILAGLLHDIGKMLIPQDILNKPEKLTREERTIVKTHAVEGYRLLAGAPNVSQDVLLGVLLHHERADGSGYPMGYPAAKIPPVARIIAIADMYEAMTSQRVFRNRLSPFDVVYEIHHDMYDKLDPELCLIFLNNIRNSLVGCLVVLNDGRKARVISAGSLAAERPVLITEDDSVINLEEHKELMIVACNAPV